MCMATLQTFWDWRERLVTQSTHRACCCRVQPCGGAQRVRRHADLLGLAGAQGHAVHSQGLLLQGFNPAEVPSAYGDTLTFWDWRERSVTQSTHRACCCGASTLRRCPARMATR